jgi:hypothetical protein
MLIISVPSSQGSFESSDHTQGTTESVTQDPIILPAESLGIAIERNTKGEAATA